MVWECCTTGSQSQCRVGRVSVQDVRALKAWPGMGVTAQGVGGGIGQEGPKWGVT